MDNQSVNKKLRKQITRKYGIITITVVFACILAISLYNYLSYVVTSRRRWVYSPLSSSSSSPKKKKSLGWSRHRIIKQPKSLLVGLFLLAFTTYVCVAETHNDVTYLVKRLGRVCVALMPPVYLLTLRPTPLPYTIYLQLLPFHKWLSRLLVLVAVLHGTLYFWVYVQTSKLFKLKKLQNISGIVAFFVFIAMALTSLRPIRRNVYRHFYTIHYTFAWLSVLLVWYHANPPANSYMAMCLVILLYQVFYRITHSSQLNLPVQYVSPSMYLVTIPMSMVPRSLRGNFTPGAHVRVSLPLTCPGSWFQSSHPYTIASLPHEDHLKLVIRKTAFPIKLRQKYAIQGPFNSLPKVLIDRKCIATARRALLVIGGSGIAFGAPVFRHLRASGVQVKMLWAIRDVKEWLVLKSLGLEDAFDDIEVYVTAARVITRVPNATSHRLFRKASMMFEDQFLNHNDELNDDEGLGISVEKDFCNGPEQGSLLGNSGGPSRNYSTMDVLDQVIMSDEARPSIFNHRPVLNLRLKSWLCGSEVNEDNCYCIDDLLEANPADIEGSWVICSGAARLVDETKAWSKDNGFSFYAEEFTL